MHVHGNESMISGLYDPLYDYIVQRIMKWIFPNGKTKLHSFINQYLFPWQIYRCMIFFQYWTKATLSERQENYLLLIDFVFSDYPCKTVLLLFSAIINDKYISFLYFELFLLVTELLLRFHGYASVCWVERQSSGHGKNKRAVAKHYSSDEIYFDHTVNVIGKST